jgi:hypothetical protein
VVGHNFRVADIRENRMKDEFNERTT